MNSQCTVRELKQLIDSGNTPVLIDVREAAELEICALPGAVHIPLNEIPNRLDDFEPYRETGALIYCHHGMRSEMARQFLEQNGLMSFRNLEGGIHLWATEVDPEMAIY